MYAWGVLVIDLDMNGGWCIGLEWDEYGHGGRLAYQEVERLCR